MNVKTFLAELAKLVIHVPAALIAGPILSLVLGMLLRDSIPYGPSVWGAGLALGFLINRQMRDRSACFVGLIGLAVLAVVIGVSYRGFENSDYYRQRYHDSFWAYTNAQLFTIDQKQCGSSECLGEVIVTTPVVSSIGYSIGAFLALRLAKKNSYEHKN